MARKTKHNSLTSPELLSQVNPKNKSLLNDFLDYLRSIQRSESTINVYRNDIEIAWVWCLQNNDNKFFVDWTKRNVVAFQNWLIYKNENSPSRVRRIKATLSSMSNFIENMMDDEYPSFRNIINRVESPANTIVRDKVVWDEESLDDLLNKLIARGDIEKACFVALAICSGRRKAELCRFKVSDFRDKNLVCDKSLYKSSPIKTKGRGNGKYIPCYTLAKKFKPYLDMWLKYREENGIDSEWLFPDKRNPKQCVPITTVDSWARTITDLTGKDFYFHSLRHYFTTSLVRAGIPDSVITQIVGWESSDMCRLYTDIDVDEQIGMYFKNGDISAPDKPEL